jgi:hypothetical protein
LGVSVDFRLEGTSGVLTNGTLTFAPGEMAKLIRAPTVDPADHNLVRVSLGHPQRVPLAEPTWVCYVRRFSQPPPPPVVLVDPGARWRFLDTGADLGAHWTAPGFSDASWGSGPAPLGYESGEATTVGYGTNASQKFVTTYFRTYFTVTNVSNLSGLTFRLRRDDGAVVYLNGGEVYRENMPTNLITYTNTAVTNVGGTASAYSTRVFATDALSQPLREGGNVLAVEVHQSGRGSSDILLDLEVDGELRPLPPLPQPIYAGVFDGVFLLAWGEPAFELEQADEAAGPWTTVAGAASPFPATPALGHAFFRLRKPGIR